MADKQQLYPQGAQLPIFDINAYKAGAKAVNINGAAITAPEGTTAPKGWFDALIDWIFQNWKLAAVAAVALVILIKE